MMQGFPGRPYLRTGASTHHQVQEDLITSAAGWHASVPACLLCATYCSSPRSFRGRAQGSRPSSDSRNPCFKLPPRGPDPVRTQETRVSSFWPSSTKVLPTPASVAEPKVPASARTQETPVSSFQLSGTRVLSTAAVIISLPHLQQRLRLSGWLRSSLAASM